MTPSRDIHRLLEIMQALRTPGTGCPWDLEQDFASIVPYTIEEAYEVADAIHKGDMDNLREELGDLLLQVVYHAQMAEEEKSFDFSDVVQSITEKMIRRHPHVFGDEKARASGMVKGAWDRIKEEEKRLKKERRAALGLNTDERPPAYLDDVPTAFAALTEAEKLQRRAAKVGFDWGESGPVLAKIREEIDEFDQELSAGTVDADRLEDELGDILFSVANLARHLDIDPEKALKRTNRKFRNRFKAIEHAAHAKETTLQDMTLNEMEQAWRTAKRMGNT